MIMSYVNVHTCNNIHAKFVPYNYTLFLIRLLLGNGCTFRWDSVIDARFLPLQFPLSRLCRENLQHAVLGCSYRIPLHWDYH